MESTNLNSARNERLFPSTSSTSASGRAEERQDEDNEKTENEPNVDDHPSVNKQQMILTCMDNPSFIAYFKYPEIIHLIRKGNTDVVVPDIGDVLEEELHKQKELIIKRLSEINYNVSVCLFKFSMNNSHYILIMLISTNDLKIIPTFMLDCFKIRTLQFPALGQIICEKLENFHISNRTTEIVIGNAELTPLRTILCERLGIKLDRSEELEKCYPQQIEMQLSKVKSKIKTLRHIFSEYPSRAMQELAKTDRVIFHRVKEDMDKLEEKINLVKKKLDDLEKHQLTNHIFYVHLMAKYPLLLFDGLNIRNFKEMLDLTYSGIETLSNIFSEIEEGPPPTKKMRLDSMESLTMYFIDSYLTKWTIISNLISNVNLKIGERHIQLTRIHASQQDTDLHCPYIQYFLDTAQNARSSRDIVDERHWMIVAFLKSWKATNIFSY